jgi:hypothetical protein
MRDPHSRGLPTVGDRAWSRRCLGSGRSRGRGLRRLGGDDRIRSKP